MSDHPAPAGSSDHRAGRRHGRWTPRRRRAGRALRARLWRVTLLPVTAALLVGGATTYGALIGGSTSATTRMIIGAGVLAVVGITVLAVLRAGALADALDEEELARAERNRELTALLDAAQGELLRLVDQAQRGERPEPADALTVTVPADTAFPAARGDADATPESVEKLVHATVHAALKAVVDVSSRGRIEVFVNLARRLQNLVIRSLDELDGLEKQVEDPDLLHGLFQLDHLVTRLRRQVESLAILGGAVPRRISRPMPVNAVLRSAVSEVEDYGRVKLVPPMTGVLQGGVAPDVIHLIAELVENAAGFSPPDTKVELRVEPAAAGLVVEIDDRGLGMQADTQERMNSLLSRATPQAVDEQIKDGRIGLLVVAHLARRHRIPVQLQRNVYGGCRATVLLPNALLMAPEETGDRAGRTAAERTAPEPQPAAAAAAQPARSAAAGGYERRPAPAASAAPQPAGADTTADGLPRHRRSGAHERAAAQPAPAAGHPEAPASASASASGHVPDSTPVPASGRSPRHAAPPAPAPPARPTPRTPRPRAARVPRRGPRAAPAPARALRQPPRPRAAPRARRPRRRIGGAPDLPPQHRPHGQLHRRRPRRRGRRPARDRRVRRPRPHAPIHGRPVYVSESLDWLLANFVQQVASARSAVVASTDGVRMHAHDLDTAAADRLAAVSTGLFSLGAGIGTDTARGVRQVLVEHEDVVLCVMAAGPGAVLAVLAEPDADLGVIGYEMGQLVKRVPSHLTAPARATTAPGLAR